jgi:hypothetical protein
MPKSKASTNRRPSLRPKKPQVVPLEYAGKFVAWSADMQIVAVADTFEACRKAAVEAGFPINQVAIDQIPIHRQRITGSWM